jgi:hypothetical protein
MVLPLLGLLGAGLSAAFRPQYEAYLDKQEGRRNNRALEGVAPGGEARALFGAGLLDADQFASLGQNESQFARSLFQDESQFGRSLGQDESQFGRRFNFDVTGAGLASNADMLGMTGTGDWSPEAARRAIFELESGGNYGAMGPETLSGDRAYGAYQVMGANIPAWTKATMGVEMTPEEFLADPAAQDKVFETIFGGNVKRYGFADAASIWHSGVPLRRAIEEGRTDGYMGTDDYTRKATGLYGAGVNSLTQIGMESKKYGANWGAMTPEGRTDIKAQEAAIADLGSVIDYVAETSGPGRTFDPVQQTKFAARYALTVRPMIQKMLKLGTLSDADGAFIEEMMGDPTSGNHWTDADKARAQVIMDKAQDFLAATTEGYGIYSPAAEYGYRAVTEGLEAVN